jgi:hypothetical protein
VTTVDFDFMFRVTPVNLGKLKKFALKLEAMIMRPYYPMPALYRVMNDDRGITGGFYAGHPRSEIVQQFEVTGGKDKFG